VQIQVFSGGPFFVNCYVLYNERGGEAAIVDPGLEITKVKAFLDHRQLTPRYILLTHGHVDHVLHLSALVEQTGAPVYLHGADQPLYDNAVEMARHFGIPNVEPMPPVDFLLADGEGIAIGDEVVKVLETPGHSPGSVSFLLPDEFVLTGDTLFNDGIGRTDLPGGSYEQILASIRTRLLVLPDHLPVYPGHGPSSTIGLERQNNPFLGR